MDLRIRLTATAVPGVLARRPSANGGGRGAVEGAPAVSRTARVPS